MIRNVQSYALMNSIEGRPTIGAGSAAGAAGSAGAASTGEKSFGDELSAAIQSVDAQSQTANAESEKLAEGGGNIHETALALEKADVSMRLLLKARNKVVEAYQELSRMPV
jgi:flagellar hook-basal body complex protein FliE